MLISVLGATVNAYHGGNGLAFPRDPAVHFVHDKHILPQKQAAIHNQQRGALRCTKDSDSNGLVGAVYERRGTAVEWASNDTGDKEAGR